MRNNDYQSYYRVIKSERNACWKDNSRHMMQKWPFLYGLGRTSYRWQILFGQFRLATASSAPLPKMAWVRKWLIDKDSPDHDYWLWTICCQRFIRVTCDLFHINLGWTGLCLVSGISSSFTKPSVPGPMCWLVLLFFSLMLRSLH